MPEIFTSIPLDSAEIRMKVWKIEEPIEFFQSIPKDWYEPIFQLKKSSHQQIESVAARYCLYEISKNLTNDPQLYYNEQGAPFLKYSPFEISLTHSYPYVAAIICLNKSIGIDIEKKGRKINKIAPRFLNVMELERWKNDEEALTLAWSMKESIYKACKTPGLSFQNSIHLPETSIIPIKINIDSEELAVYWELFDDFVLSIAHK